MLSAATGDASAGACGAYVAVLLGVAFRLKPEESARKGLRRVLKKELDGAISELEANRLSGEAVHEARKHIKKARAVIRLVAHAIDTEKAPDDLRHAGRLLSRMRDAKAIAEDAETLLASTRRSLSRDTRLALHDLFQRRKARSRGSAERHHAIGHAHAAMTRVRRCVGDWDWFDVTHRQFDRAIQRSYKRARRTMTRARTVGEAAEFHAWRKRVKHLWYALRLVQHTSPALLRQVAQLECIEEWLGHDHNLFVLRTRLQGTLPIARDASRISVLLARRQGRLRQMALKAGASFFKAPPKAFGRRLRGRAA